jgi:hypothetical protein
MVTKYTQSSGSETKFLKKKILPSNKKNPVSHTVVMGGGGGIRKILSLIAPYLE